MGWWRLAGWRLEGEVKVLGDDDGGGNMRQIVAVACRRTRRDSLERTPAALAMILTYFYTAVQAHTSVERKR